MTTDPFSKEAAAEATRARRDVPGRRHGQGLGHDRADDGDDARVRHHGRRVEPALLQRALKAAVDDTFNAISVDGECSTNDCVFALANGASGVQLAEDGLSRCSSSALKLVCEPLAIDIVRGGEGATKLITIRVTGAKTDEDAKTTARAIANSPLVKTAVHGGDPELGPAGRGRRPRHANAGAGSRAGSASARSSCSANGAPYDERAPEAAEYLQGKDIALEVDLGTGGSGEARMWSCDLTAEYVRINAEYRT